MIGASELIETTIKLYRTHFRALLKNVIWLFAVLDVLQIGVELLLRRSGIPAISPVGTAVFGVFLLIQLALMIMLIAASDRIIMSTQLKLSELAQTARTRFLPALGVYFSIGILMAAVGLPAFFNQKLPALMIAGVMATIVSIFFSFSPPEIILRGGTLKNALLASPALIRGRFWRVAWRLIAPTLFFGVAISLLGTVFAYALSGTAQELAKGLLNALVAPLFIIPLILLYHDIKR